MSFQFIEVSPDAVCLDPKQVESEDDHFIYEHLKRYLSKSTRLPAITVKSQDGKLLSAARHKYLAIARELGFERIRAVLQNETYDQLKAKGVPGVLSVVPIQELEDEQRTQVVIGWHVFFFKATPSPEVASEIETRFRAFLNQSLSETMEGKVAILVESNFDFFGPCFEIRFPTPVANQVWAKSYHNFISSVHRELWPIESYQGRRFEQ